MADLAPFRINVPDFELERIKQRIRDYEWFEEPVDSDWQYGCNGAYLRELCDYWLHDFDWRAAEKKLNRFSQFKTPVDGIDIHFIREEGSNPDNDPVVILHGWPGSFVEHLEIIHRLAHPGNFGGDAADGRDVIVPSLVGYGFSGKPPKPLGPRGQAPYFCKLMHENLGYETFTVQGGDWGALIAAWMGFDFGTNKSGPVKAIHTNLMGVRPAGDAKDARGNPVAMPETEEEIAWAKEAAKRFEWESGYFEVQATKPQSLAYGMMDSPVGVAAWLTEKFHTWSDRSNMGAEGGDIENVYTKDQLLMNIMVYITSRTFNTSTWQYRGVRDEGSFTFPPGERVEVPTGIAGYPREIAPIAPRSYAEKGYNVVHYVEQPRGGHFAAFEQPELFADDVLTFLKGWG